MKLKTIFLAALCAGIHSASAFSLDFTGLNDGENGELNGATFSGADNDQQTITVPDFGRVTFGVGGDDKSASAVISDSFGPLAIEAPAGFDSDLVITINFESGSDVENVFVNFIGADGPTTGPLYQIVSPQSGTVVLPAGAIGISSLTFDRIGPKVPEPSTALLGGLGLLALLRRRR